MKGFVGYRVKKISNTSIDSTKPRVDTKIKSLEGITQSFNVLFFYPNRPITILGPLNHDIVEFYFVPKCSKMDF